MDLEWEERRDRELNFSDGDPAVLIIGAGHTGLEIAARLKYMSVSTLVIDKHARIGDSVSILASILDFIQTVVFTVEGALQVPCSSRYSL